MHTMGHRVVELEPIHGFAAETTGASVIYGAALSACPSRRPTSSPARSWASARAGARAGVHWGVARSILIAWVLTIPAAGSSAPPPGTSSTRSVSMTSRSASIQRQPEAHDGSTDPQGREVLRPVHRGRREPARGRPQARGDGQQTTTGSTSGSPRSRPREARATRSTTRSRRGSSGRSSRRSTARTSTSSSSRLDDVVDGIQETAETFVIYGITQPTTRSSSSSGSSGQAVQLLEALDEARERQGHRAPPQAVHELEHKADGLSRAAIGRLFRGGHRPARGHQAARRLHRPRGHDRRRRGRGRGHRADPRQERLIRAAPRAIASALAGDRHAVRDRQHAPRWTRGSPDDGLVDRRGSSCPVVHAWVGDVTTPEHVVEGDHPPGRTSCTQRS